MSIYTKSGDGGKTHLIGNVKRSKSDAVFEVLGTLDELNSALGIVVASVELTPDAREFFLSIQNTLFDLGALVANPKTRPSDFDWLQSLTVDLEKRIDELSASLSPLKNFILPGGTNGAALTHYARAVCRRAERNLVSHFDLELEEASTLPIQYVNRLSDFLFTFARYINSTRNQPDILWQARKTDSIPS